MLKFIYLTQLLILQSGQIFDSVFIMVIKLINCIWPFYMELCVLLT